MTVTKTVNKTLEVYITFKQNVKKANLIDVTVELGSKKKTVAMENSEEYANYHEKLLELLIWIANQKMFSFKGEVVVSAFYDNQLSPFYTDFLEVNLSSQEVEETLVTPTTKKKVNKKVEEIVPEVVANIVQTLVNYSPLVNKDVNLTVINLIEGNI